MVHPSGRLLQYGSRIEVQVEDKMSVKNAKVHPKGISFTANNMALVYLLDDAGARSTSDMFHDLHASHVVNTLFSEVAKMSNCGAGTALGVEMLHTAQYWRDHRGCDKWTPCRGWWMENLSCSGLLLTMARSGSTRGLCR